MAIVKIGIKQLGDEKFEVKQSSRNEIKVFEAQAEIADMQSEMDGMAESEQPRAAVKMYKMPINFLTDILNLSEEQTEVLWEQSLAENMDLFGMVAGRLLGLSEQDLEKGLPKAQK